MITRRCDLYSQIHSDETLAGAWRSVRSHRGASPGADGVTLGAFQLRLLKELRSLQNELRTRRYRPGAVRSVTLPKAGGGVRRIGILNVRDRVVQRAVLHVIGPLLDARFDDASYGFRPGRSVRAALDCAIDMIDSRSCWIARFDIALCFESVDRTRLRRQLRKHIRDRRLRSLIEILLLLNCQRRGGCLAGKKPARGLVQGCPLSPLFANLYLDQFDKAARRAGLSVVRYADDVLVVADSRAEATAALEICRRLLAGLDMETNPGKTHMRSIRDGVVFLGVEIRWDSAARRAIWRKVPWLFELGAAHESTRHISRDSRRETCR